MIGLAWDCGAVTTGPVTVPVVLALGSGVAQSMNSGDNDSIASSTFGIVTLASLYQSFLFLPFINDKSNNDTINNDTIDNKKINKMI